MSQACGTGQGKLILFGEHAAVYGRPAIGVQLPERTTVTLREARTGGWHLDGIPAEDCPAARRLLGRLEKLLPDLARRGGSALSIESTIPRAVGLGSSAALCLATARAALAFVQENRPDHDGARSWELAHALERLFHGTPSGIDTGLSLHEGLTAYSPRPPALPGWEQVFTVPFWIVAGAVPRARGSAALIRGLGERMSVGEKKVVEGLSELGRIAAQVKQELAGAAGADRAASIGAQADAAMGILRGLGLSDPRLDALLEEGRRTGALGGKLSGAGGGGAFFLVVESEEAGRTTAAGLQDAARDRGIGFALEPRALCVA